MLARTGGYVGSKRNSGSSPAFSGGKGQGDLNTRLINRVGSLRVGAPEAVNVGGGQDAGSDDHASWKPEEATASCSGRRRTYDVGLSQGSSLSGESSHARRQREASRQV